MKFIKLTRVLDPHDYRVGYYGSVYAPSHQSYIPSSGSQIVYTSTSGGLTSVSSGGSSSSGHSTGFLQGLTSMMGLGQQQQSSQATQNQLAAQQAQLSSGQALGQMQQYTSTTIASQLPIPDQTQEIWLPIDSIKYIAKVMNQNYSSLINLGNDSLYIVETPEQIMKMMHDQEFNAKMDDILK